MRAGLLHYRFAIKAVPTTKSITGAEIPGVLSTVFEAQFSVATKPGGEPTKAEKQYAELRHTLTGRYRPSVIPTMQAHGLTPPFTGRILDITDVDESRSRRGELILHCLEYRTSATP